MWSNVPSDLSIPLALSSCLCSAVPSVLLSQPSLVPAALPCRGFSAPRGRGQPPSSAVCATSRTALRCLLLKHSGEERGVGQECGANCSKLPNLAIDYATADSDSDINLQTNCWIASTKIWNRGVKAIKGSRNYSQTQAEQRGLPSATSQRGSPQIPGSCDEVYRPSLPSNHHDGFILFSQDSLYAYTLNPSTGVPQGRMLSPLLFFFFNVRPQLSSTLLVIIIIKCS